ncbi:hypothetical protein ABH922_001761 [Rhodococcus sp. 27YEA15]|uniref:hypothetical protein n=1 Tax=Rhodococcus sp. 27YEA15 TaxID=3156259 RepID=UPI003C7CF6BA
MFRADSEYGEVAAVSDLLPAPRDDYGTFAALSVASAASGRSSPGGRSARQWTEHLDEQWRPVVVADGDTTPSFDQFWPGGHVRMRIEGDPFSFGDVRDAPARFPSRHAEWRDRNLLRDDRILRLRRPRWVSASVRARGMVGRTACPAMCLCT